MNTILGLGFILVAGLFSARLINRFRLPAVTAYLALGILIGPGLLGLISKDILNASGTISNIVLGIIAFSIGQGFSRDTFFKIGKSVMWISICEVCGAWLLVTAVFLFVLRQPFYVAILFGAIASATAPATTVMVIREYRAKGNLTDTLLGVVAIDDAWCLTIFAISLAVSRAVQVHMVSTAFLVNVFLKSMLAIGGAFFLGAAVGGLLSYLARFLRTQTELLTFTLGFILLNIGIAIWLNLSVLLASMFLGAVLVNINQTSFKFFDALKTIDPPLFLIFFVLAGANLEIATLPSVGLIGLAYVLFRLLGKVWGAGAGAHLAHASPEIRKYVGWGLIPQAGVALGCALVVKSNFPGTGSMIFNTIVATTIIYEFIGPVCTKIALEKAGEAGGEH